MRSAAVRLPFDSLIPIVDARWHPRSPFVGHIGHVGKAAQVLGVNRQTTGTWRRIGLSPLQADRAAVRLGLHPSAIWPEWWDTA